MRGVWDGSAVSVTPADKRAGAAVPNSGPPRADRPHADSSRAASRVAAPPNVAPPNAATPTDKQPDTIPPALLPSSSRARRRKSFTVHLGSAGRITLASRDNQAAVTHRPATLRVGARGSVLRIGTSNRANTADKSATADDSAAATPPIPPE